jgi:hypothetical protein
MVASRPKVTFDQMDAPVPEIMDASLNTAPNQATYFEPEGGVSMYLQNTGNITHNHIV